MQFENLTQQQNEQLANIVDRQLNVMYKIVKRDLGLSLSDTQLLKAIMWHVAATEPREGGQVISTAIDLYKDYRIEQFNIKLAIDTALGRSMIGKLAANAESLGQVVLDDEQYIFLKRYT